MSGHLIGGLGQLANRGRRRCDLLRLMFRRFSQMHCGGLGFLRRRRHLQRGFVNRGHQGAQCFHRVIDRVGNRAGDVFGHGRLYRQVAFCEGSHFIQQSQNSFLVTLVELGAVLEAALLIAERGHRQQDHEQHGQSRSTGAPPDIREDALRRQRAETLRHLVGLDQHALAIGETIVRRGFHFLHAG